MSLRSPSQWTALSALYEEADELDEVALADWLDGQRRQGQPLLDQLERMLEARTQVQSSDFLEKPARYLKTDEALAGDWCAGQTLGVYTLTAPLGSGGMAEVWLAKRSDGAFERNVAIKLLYGDASVRRRTSFVQRFERERDILASLNHRHIAKLLDAGVAPSGQPWIALEYVKGKALTDYCDQHKLSPRARVELFMQVLLAVQYAHANLVIHRDIKPPNILVTEQGQVQLLDFGIAKIIESQDQQSTDTALTQQAGRPLTLLYASPEQTRGEPLSTGSDVYSLGVVLYLLLCGENPYELQRESAAFLEQAIQEVDPRAPSRRALTENTALLRSCTPHSLRVELANDLDAIVLKALHKRSDQRYASAEAFHADLQRWLDGKAVLAKPPSRIYYASKFVLRHRWAVGLGASAVVALITLTVLATLFGVQASRQSARASASRDFLIDMFRQADPELTGGREISAKELLTTAKGTLMAKLPGQPLLQGELLHGLGMAQSNMSEYLQADQTMASAAQIYQRLDKLSDAAVVSIDQAEAVYSAGDYARAKALLAQASQMRALQDLPAASQATFHTVNATLELSTGDVAKARSEVQLAVQLNTQAYGLNHSKTVRTLVLQGRIQTQAGDFDGARQSLNQAKEQVDQSPQLEPSELGNLLGAQAQLELALGQAAKAEALFDRAATRCEQLFNPMGEECVVLRNRQVGTLLAMGQTDKAQKYLPSLQSQIQNSGSPRRQAEALLSASRLIARSRLQGEYPAIWSQLVALSESGPEIKATEVNKLWAMSIRSESALQNGNPKLALQMLERVEKRIDSKSLAMQNLAANVHGLLGVASAMQGQLTAAHPYFEQAMGELQRANANVAAVQSMRARQAIVLAAEGKLTTAKAQLNTAYEILRNAYGSTSPVVIKIEAKLQALTNLQSNTLPAPLAADFFL